MTGERRSSAGARYALACAWLVLALAALLVPRLLAERSIAAGHRGLEASAAVALTFFVLAGLALLVALAGFVLTIVRRRSLTGPQSVLGVAPLFLSILGLGFLWIIVRLRQEPAPADGAGLVPTVTAPALDVAPAVGPDVSPAASQE